VPWPENWLALVNRAQSEAEVAALRRCVQRGQPFGGESWTKRTRGLEKGPDTFSGSFPDKACFVWFGELSFS